MIPLELAWLAGAAVLYLTLVMLSLLGWLLQMIGWQFVVGVVAALIGPGLAVVALNVAVEVCRGAVPVSVSGPHRFERLMIFGLAILLPRRDRIALHDADECFERDEKAHGRAYARAAYWSEVGPLLLRALKARAEQLYRLGWLFDLLRRLV